MGVTIFVRWLKELARVYELGAMLYQAPRIPSVRSGSILGAGAVAPGFEILVL